MPSRRRLASLKILVQLQLRHSINERLILIRSAARRDG
jgi:hypothetical protein